MPTGEKKQKRLHFLRTRRGFVKLSPATRFHRTEYSVSKRQAAGLMNPGSSSEDGRNNAGQNDVWVRSHDGRVARELRPLRCRSASENVCVTC